MPVEADPDDQSLARRDLRIGTGAPQAPAARCARPRAARTVSVSVAMS